MKKLIAFTLGLFVACASFCGMAKAMGEPRGANDDVHKLMVQKARQDGEQIMQQQAINVQIGAIDAIVRQLFKQHNISYQICKYYYENGITRTVYRIPQIETSRKICRWYVCDYLTAVTMIIGGSCVSPESWKQFLWMDEDTYISKCASMFRGEIQCTKIEWFDESGRMVDEAYPE